MTATPVLPVTFLVAALCAGCAATNDDTPRTAEVLGAREYRTGSNIPRKETVPATEEERARAAEQANDLKRNSSTGRPTP